MSFSYLNLFFPQNAENNIFYSKIAPKLLQKAKQNCYRNLECSKIIFRVKLEQIWSIFFKNMQKIVLTEKETKNAINLIKIEIGIKFGIIFWDKMCDLKIWLIVVVVIKRKKDISFINKIHLTFPSSKIYDNILFSSWYYGPYAHRQEEKILYYLAFVVHKLQKQCCASVRKKGRNCIFLYLLGIFSFQKTA